MDILHNAKQTHAINFRFTASHQKQLNAHKKVHQVKNDWCKNKKSEGSKSYLLPNVATGPCYSTSQPKACLSADLLFHHSYFQEKRARLTYLYVSMHQRNAFSSYPILGLIAIVPALIPIARFSQLPAFTGHKLLSETHTDPLSTGRRENHTHSNFC